MEERDRKKYRIVGVVQGVGFRNWAREISQVHQLRGWVKNEVDSSVTILLIGEEIAITKVADKLKIGVSGSEVLDITALALDQEDIDWNHEEFQIIS